MIGYFPEAYPDELFYSICARYGERGGYNSPYQVLRELYGTIEHVPIVAFPTRLGSVVDSLPPGHHYTVDRLIDEHTLLPFYGPFLPPERLQAIREDMTKGDGHYISMRMGTTRSQIPDLIWLRFCPRCVAADRQRYGEAYWHRSHQLEGIPVCPVHAVWLEDSVVNATHLYRFVTVEEAVRHTNAHELDLSKTFDGVLFRLAQDSFWLLQQKSLSAGPGDLRKRYLYILAEKGLVAYTFRQV